MLITLCYSVLTYCQSRQRQLIQKWVDDCCVTEKASLIFLRDDRPGVGRKWHHERGTSWDRSSQDRSRSCSRDRDYNSSAVSRSESTNSNFSTPRRDNNDQHTDDGTSKLRQVSDLCYNSINTSRLIWEEDKAIALCVFPVQIVDLHDFCGFIGTKIGIDLPNSENLEEPKKIYILLEALPGAIQSQENYRKFSQFGKITAWKCGPELALILLSELDHQLVDLMHIFRLGQIVLEGGWRVYRLTTITCEGTIGTLISQSEALTSRTTLTPGDLHRLSAGIFECRDRETPVGTPKNSLSKEQSKHDIATISEEISVEDPEDDILKLPNWYDRSPKKRSIATISNADKQILGRRRVGSFSSGTLNSSKSSSLASLLFCTKSMSVEEEDTNIKYPVAPYANKINSLPFSQQQQNRSQAPRQSFENLLGSPNSATGSPKGHQFGSQSNSQVQSPLTETPVVVIGSGCGPGPNGKPFKSYSAFSSPKKSASVAASHGMSNIKRTPNRIGKPPNILVLCEDSKKRTEIAGILKSMLANDRYAIYDIRWNQLAVGGWADQTALLVLAGSIPDLAHVPLLLQFLGDGGRLFAWCCETAPFGIKSDTSTLATSEAENRTAEQKQKSNRKSVLTYGPSSSSQTRPISVSPYLWGVNSTPFSILETNDSEGYSRPLTASVFAKTKDTNETGIVQLDGGALGGKAVLSRVHFEDSKDEESSSALLSFLLGQILGIDCTKIKTLEYTYGYLVGDHMRVKEFISSVPAIIQQPNLTIEWVPRGEKGSKPSQERFSVRTLECPSNFSTLEYFNNLTSKDLGRLVIYTDVMTSVMHVFNGHSLKHGLVVIAGRQTAGRGRGSNVWLSPEGSVCFGVQLDIKLDSQLGRRLPLVQHCCAMSVIFAIPNHKEINLRMKWPNDIYLDDQKIGGVLVETKIEGKVANVTVGIGINLSNSHPTVCLNSLLGEKEKLSSPALVAKCLSQMEVILDRVENGGLNQVLTDYTENWIHQQDDVVNVEVSGGNYAECQISGVDEFGFLRVTDVNSGHVFSVQPDGNSFDIANKLIAIKT